MTYISLVLHLKPADEQLALYDQYDCLPAINFIKWPCFSWG